MKYLTVRHATHYRYAQPVTLGTHRLMLRPRDSHDLRLVDAELTLSPPGETRWMHDVFGNSVAEVEFEQSATELLIVSTLHLEHYGLTRPVFPIAPDAQVYPFVYSADDRADLGRLLDRHYPDPNGLVDAWAKRFVKGRFMSTYNLLSNINGAIKSEFAYNARYEEGTQTPIETLERGSGTCRDFALLFIEAVRCLGFGARFVTGYLYDPALDGADGAMQGSGATHAWADVYLPGAGWVEYDPTNGLIAGDNLIRIAVTRDPSQAIPIGGTFEGRPGEFLGMSVEVTVHAGMTPHSSMSPAESVQASPPIAAPAGQAVETTQQPAPVSQAEMSPQQMQSQNAQLTATVQPMQNAEPAA
ncbi:MAG TPA: transglutaminase N-terminal domain-containing protein [Pseudolabrys sp.]